MRSDIEQRRSRLHSRHDRWTRRTLGDWLDHCAREFADRPFVVTDDLCLTYRETADLAARLADGLAALGVRPGDRVGLLMANFPQFVPLKFAIAKAGAVAIPFNYLYRHDELAYVLEQSACSVLITMTDFADQDYQGLLDTAVPGWQHGTAANAPELRHVVALPTGTAAREGVLTVEALADLGRAHTGAADASSVRPDDIGDVLYTSGTTGSPKGVLITHDAVLRTAYASALTRAFEDGRRILFSLPCYHMFGYVEGLLAAMVVGGSVVLQTAFDALRYLEGVQRHRATDILCVPTMSIALLEHPRRAEFDLSSLTAILSGSAPAPIWLWERIREELGVSEIVTGYGMTETGGAMTLTLPEDELALTATTVGRPKLGGVAGLPGADALTEYKTIDPETGADLPPHTPGELASRGPTTMTGFWRKPEETALALTGGWVRSGDLGRVREDGYLEVTGRSKELYKSGGELVMPKEIEDLLSQHPAVSQVYAVAVPDDRWGDAGCLCVVRVPGQDVSADELLGLCRAKLARFKVPKHVLFLEAAALPTTPTGKVQKFRLGTWARERITAKTGTANQPRERKEPKGHGAEVTTTAPDANTSVARPDYARLIQPDRVHGSLYTDPQIFQEELERIWYRTWVYVGHASEVPQPNDYVRKNIGPQDIVMTRAADGEIHLLLNRCAHRANLVCEDAKGNSSSFRCPYHGWTYRNTGELLGYPYNKGYGGKGKLDLRMGRVPRVASHQGFVFASFAEDGPSLAEHLGEAAGELDRLARLSPEGEVQLNAGWLKHRTKANWKLLAENETDGYHPQFVHGSIFSVTGSPIGALYSDNSTAVTRNLGGGHSENDLRPEFRKFDEPMRWFGTTEERVPDYVAAMRALHGEDAERILVEGAPHVMIFPNLFIAEIQVFVIQPLSAGECVQHSTAVQLRGAPELNRRMVSQSIGSVGPAGMLLADDTEMYERNQRGVQMRSPEWLDLRRGLQRERVDERGLKIGTATDETGMRGFWAHYRGLMEDQA